MDDLAGKKVGLTGGTLEDLEITDSAPDDTEIIRFGDNAATIAAYVSKQVDVLVTGNTVAAKVSADNPDLGMETKFIIKESPASAGGTCRSDPVRAGTAADAPGRFVPPVPAQGRSLATRKPTLMSENPTGFLTRLAGRLARGRLSQEPPRIMRCRQAASGSMAEPSDGAPS